MKRCVLILLVAVVACCFGVKTSLADCGTCDKTIVEVAGASEDFKTLVAAVKACRSREDLVRRGAIYGLRTRRTKPLLSCRREPWKRFSNLRTKRSWWTS